MDNLFQFHFGIFSSYQVRVQKNSRVSRRSTPEFRHYTENPSAYVAAELSGGLPEKFVIGDNKTYGSYFNPPLQEGAAYTIHVGAVSRINATVKKMFFVFFFNL